MSVDIIQGECRAVLAALPADSVHTCITSPPFYALRDYKLPPSVWGGDPDCVHDWGQWDEAHDEREEVAHGKTRTTERCYGEPSRRFDGNHQKHTAGAFCLRCGAWLGCLGLEPTPALFVAHMVEVFAAVHRVLHPSGTAWLNLGDSFAGSWGNYAPGGITHTQRGQTEQGQRWERRAYSDTTFKPPSATAQGFKAKDLMMLPHRVAIALQEWGWWIRSTIVWEKPNPMPESITDRPTQSHEYLFLLTKSERYFYDADAIREPMACSSIERLRQPTFEQQQGGVKDYSNGINSNRSARKALNNLHEKLVKQEKWKARYEGWAERDKSIGRNKRSVWTIATEAYADAHFATFPQKLVAPCILAGSSEAGCCSVCRAPWRRVTERTFQRQEDVSAERGVRGGAGQKPMDASNGWQGWPRGATAHETTGWEPGCACDSGAPAPCMVLDPFAGSGTTGLVAKRLGRRAVLVDLSPAYCELAQQRIDSVPYTLFSAASSSEGAAR